jgi:hypothetical protein
MIGSLRMDGRSKGVGPLSHVRQVLFSEVRPVVFRTLKK